jgi:hypothetical protein
MDERVDLIVNQLMQQQPGGATGKDFQDDGKKKTGLPLLQAAPNVHVLPQSTALPGQAVLLPGSMNNTSQVTTAPLILNLSQLQGSNDLIILSGQNAARISIISNSQNVQGGATAAQGVAPKIIQTPVTLGNVGQVAQVVGAGDMPDSSVCDTVPLTSSVFNSTPPAPAFTTAAPNMSSICPAPGVISTGSTFVTSALAAAPDSSTACFSSMVTACTSAVPDHLPGLKRPVYPVTTYRTDTQNTNIQMDSVNFNPNVNAGAKCDNIADTSLHLTQDEIQKTLAANMPSESSEVQNTQNTTDMTDMQQNVSTPTSADLNFDAFDLLDLNDLGTEFDGLTADLMITETCEKDKQGPIAALGCNTDLNRNSSVGKEGKTGQALADVTDYSPDWSYPEVSRSCYLDCSTNQLSLIHIWTNVSGNV